MDQSRGVDDIKCCHAVTVLHTLGLNIPMDVLWRKTMIRGLITKMDKYVRQQLSKRAVLMLAKAIQFIDNEQSTAQSSHEERVLQSQGAFREQ
jgi:hypothetical protein